MDPTFSFPAPPSLDDIFRVHDAHDPSFFPVANAAPSDLFNFLDVLDPNPSFSPSLPSNPEEYFSYSNIADGVPNFSIPLGDFNDTLDSSNDLPPVSGPSSYAYNDFWSFDNVPYPQNSLLPTLYGSPTGVPYLPLCPENRYGEPIPYASGSSASSSPGDYFTTAQNTTARTQIHSPTYTMESTNGHVRASSLTGPGERASEPATTSLAGPNADHGGRRPVRGADKPKRASNGFLEYRAWKSRKLKEEAEQTGKIGPALLVGRHATEVAKTWYELSEEERNVWRERARMISAGELERERQPQPIAVRRRAEVTKGKKVVEGGVVKNKQKRKAGRKVGDDEPVPRSRAMSLDSTLDSVVSSEVFNYSWGSHVPADTYSPLSFPDPEEATPLDTPGLSPDIDARTPPALCNGTAATPLVFNSDAFGQFARGPTTTFAAFAEGEAPALQDHDSLAHSPDQMPFAQGALPGEFEHASISDNVVLDEETTVLLAGVLRAIESEGQLADPSYSAFASGAEQAPLDNPGNDLDPVSFGRDFELVWQQSDVPDLQLGLAY